MGYDLWVDMSGTILRLFDGTPIDINSIPTEESTRAILNNESGQICNQCICGATRACLIWPPPWFCEDAVERLCRGWAGEEEVLLKDCSIEWNCLTRREWRLPRAILARRHKPSLQRETSIRTPVMFQHSTITTNQFTTLCIVLFLKGSPELKYNIWGWRLDQLSFKHCTTDPGYWVFTLNNLFKLICSTVF